MSLRHFFFTIVGVASFACASQAQMSPVRWTVSTLQPGPAFVEGALPTKVGFGTIGGFTVDRTGAYYVSSRTHNQVYRIHSGTTTLVAGVGGSSYGLPVGGDGGPAHEARLNEPLGLSIDSRGNLYIADSGYHRIRKVDAQGTITTYAGTGASGFSGDGTPATSAKLARPENVLALRNGSLLISDVLNHRIRSVDSSGVITTFAGDGRPTYAGDGVRAETASLHYPRGLAEDSNGLVFLADYGNGRVRVIDRYGRINTIGGGGSFPNAGGPATSSSMTPLSLAIDSQGGVYVGESNYIRRINLDGSLTVIASYPATEVYGVVAIDVSTGLVLFAQADSGIIQQTSPGGPATTLAGVHLDRSVAMILPRGIATDPDRNVYIGSTGGNIWKYSTVAGVTPITDPGLSAGSMAVDGQGNIYISDGAARKVYLVRTRDAVFGSSVSVVAGNGRAEFSGDGGPATAAGLNSPGGIALDTQGNLFIADTGNNRIRKVTPDGIISTVAGTTAGAIGDYIPALTAFVPSPRSVAVDAAGNLYISQLRWLRKVDTNGIISYFAGTNQNPTQSLGGPVSSTPIDPWAVAVDAAGNVYFTEPSISRVSRLTPNRMIERIAGTGSAGFNGEAGPGLSVQLNFTNLCSIAVDAAGIVYLSDTFNDRVRRIAPENNVSFAAPDRGVASVRTAGTAATVSVGHARIRGSSTPTGFAIYGLRQNGVLISEASVPATPAVNSGAFYAESTVTVSTGLAISNPNAQPAKVFYELFAVGQPVGIGSVIVPANGQIAAFLNQPPYNQGFTGGALFMFTSQLKVAAVALRGLNNDRGEFLVTTLPVANITGSGQPDIPHFADGAGWTTRITLLNPTPSAVSGRAQFRDRSGTISSDVAYSIPAKSFVNLAMESSDGSVRGGQVRLVPDGGSGIPFGTVLFSYRERGVTVTESTVEATASGTAFQSYVELFGNFGSPSSIQSGLAVSNSSGLSATVNFEITQADGQSTGITGTFSVPANGQTAFFLNQLPEASTIPKVFQGMLRLSGSQAIAVAGIRGRYNERGEFLITTTPAVNESSASPSGDLFFPHIVDSGGYSTQFILFNRGMGLASSGTIQLFSQSGAAVDWGTQ